MKKLARPRTLINEAYLKEYSPLPQNFDISEVIPYIKPTELIWIVPILGQPLYDELLQQVADNNLTEENSTLLLASILISPLLSAMKPYLSLAIISLRLV